MGPITELFVDESFRGDYLLCAAVVAADEIAAARKIMRELTPKNRNRLHTHAESRHRDRIIKQFVSRPPISEAHIFVRPRQPGVRESQRQARTRCLQALAEFAADTGAGRILVESCAQDKQDRAALTNVLAARGALDHVRVDVDKPTAHELLWAADLVAWAYGAGGTSRATINHLVTIHRI